MEIDVGTNNLFRFMFGNVDEAGDLDVDYLDDDAKDHLAALPESLCSPLIDFSHTLADSIHQDYDHENKAEDAVHYEDIDEQYVEISQVTLDNLGQKTSCFDNENYDEDEQEDDIQEPLSDQKSRTPSLSVLYMEEDGRAVLRFSQIFGNHEPMNKRKKKSCRYSSLYKDRDNNKSFYAVEEDDDEAFLRGPCQYSSSFTMKETSTVYNEESHIFDVSKGINANTTAKDAEQRKPAESVSVDLASWWGSSSSCPYFCPLEQQHWENDIIWGNSSDGSSESCIPSEVESEACENHRRHFLSSYPIVLESFGSKEFSDHANILEKKHPQQLRLELCLKVDASSYSDGVMENGTKLFSKGVSQNLDMLEDSWVDKIIWDSDEAAALKTKLILDLQDEHMLFEIPESKDVRHLSAHATAMIIERSVKPHGGDSFDLTGQFEFSNEFNLSNDKYYSDRTATQQLKSHSKNLTENSGLDSVAGNLENLVDAKECEMEDEVGNYESKHNEKNAIKGLEMTRHPSARKPVVCGTCGQIGHIRTNKSCPLYRDQDSAVQVECIDGPGKLNIIDPSTNLLQKTSTSIALVKTSENFEKAGSKTKVLPLKLKCGKEVDFDAESGPRSVNKISRIVCSNKLKVGDLHVKPLKLIIKPLAEVERDQPRKKIIIKPPRGDTTTVEQVKQESKWLAEEVGMKVKGSSKNDRRLPGRDCSAKRQSVVELETYGAEYAPQRKRSRGGERDVLLIPPITS
ncbi:Transcription initiation factor tfiid subunit [Thalictrum thalictroides]|uniref:Transcription initiation factor tfiid subunit n=1 Tax=Thalictrum thalictroides TaxID=46969 RepID=A0A7J6VLR9_THATH|nr:Transcription initiation factor tfiid subunit [Thalictrum thalictroides]